MFDQVLSALSYAHKQHIIHRDIKPSNMMLTPQGTVKLMDFGIAQRGDQGELTKTNTTVGSFAYMSPEQIKGEPVDARSDLYSVGVSLYEMVTGQRPFPADTAFSAMQAHLQTPPTPPIEVRPDLPLPLSQLIVMAVAKDPAARFQSADAFAAALQTVMPRVAGTVAAIPVPATAVIAGAAAPAMRTAAAGTPTSASAVPTAAPAAPIVAAHPSHRGLYIALGAAIVVVVLAVAAIIPWHARTEALKKQNAAQAAGGVTPPAPATAPVPPPSTPTADTATPPNAATDASSSTPASAPTSDSAAPTPSATVNPTPVAKKLRASPKATAQTATPADAAQSASPPAPAVDPAQMQALDLENDQLSGRASAVSASLDNLQKQQAAQGLGLRGDIVASQQRMQSYMSKAQAAIQAQDAASARKYLDLAAAEVEKLEKFLGR